MGRGLLTQGCLPTCQVPPPFILDFTNCVILKLFLLLIVVPILLLRKVCSSLSLSSVLYIPNFLVNLLSISVITNTLFCSIKFFPYHFIIRDFWTEMSIGSGHETRCGLHKLDFDSPFPDLSCFLSYKPSSIE